MAFSPRLTGATTLHVARLRCSAAAAARAHGRLLASAAALSLADAAPAAAQARDPAHIAAAVDSIVADALAGGRVAGLSVAVVRGGDTLVLEAYGKADLELDVPTPARAVYAIGSLTKQSTAAAILQLQERGALSLDDDLTRHLPTYPTRGHRVTLRRLLDHTSGIASYPEMRELWKFDVDAPPPDSLITLFAAHPFAFAPGAAMVYNNSGYFLLGRVIERVSGMPYGAYVQRHLFERAGMLDSRYCTNAAVVPRRAHGYTLDDDTLRLAQLWDPGWPYAAGALCSTVGDLVAWTRALHGGRILGPAAYRELLTPGRLADGAQLRYAGGLAVDSILGHRAVHHGGAIQGFRSDLIHLPDDSLTVVVLINTGGPVNPETISRSIAAVVVGNRSPTGVAFRRRPADYVGEYRGIGPGGAQALTIHTDGAGGLTLRTSGEQPRPLTYHGGETFGARNARHEFGERYTFMRHGGRVTRVRADAPYGHAVLVRTSGAPAATGDTR